MKAGTFACSPYHQVYRVCQSCVSCVSCFTTLVLQFRCSKASTVEMRVRTSESLDLSACAEYVG